MEVFGEADWTCALCNLKGCHEHFQVQITWIRRNRTIVSVEQEVDHLIPILLYCGLYPLSNYSLVGIELREG
jgi:hypothetical protein